MGKTVLAPVYLSFAWILIISYQLFTQTAVNTVLNAINTLWPSQFSLWMLSRVETITIIHAFAWIFLLSSVIPSSILSNRNSVSLQFFFCLIISIGSTWITSLLPLLTDKAIVEDILSLTGFFNHPFFAITFLALPYVFMISLDIRSRRRKSY